MIEENPQYKGGNSRKKTIALIVALVMIAGCLLACTKATTEQPKTEPKTETKTEANAPQGGASAGSNEVTLTENDKIVWDGTLTCGMNVDVNTYASWRIRSGQEKTALSPVYETLMRFDPEGNLQPYLAESLTADQEKLTYTVKLRDGITFPEYSKLSDGWVDTIRELRGQDKNTEDPIQGL